MWGDYWRMLCCTTKLDNLLSSSTSRRRNLCKIRATDRPVPVALCPIISNVLVSLSSYFLIFTFLISHVTKDENISASSIRCFVALRCVRMFTCSLRRGRRHVSRLFEGTISYLVTISWWNEIFKKTCFSFWLWCDPETNCSQAAPLNINRYKSFQLSSRCISCISRRASADGEDEDETGLYAAHRRLYPTEYWNEDVMTDVNVCQSCATIL